MRVRIARLAAAAAVHVVALVLAHELVFLARYGSIYNEALVHAGHGQLWSGAVATSLALGALLLVLGTFQLARLGILVRRRAPQAGHHAGSPAGSLEARSLLRSWLRAAPRMAVLSVLLLTAQENLERAAIGQAMPGLGVLLSPEYAGGLWITIAVAFGVAFVVALFTWHRGALLARLRAGRRAFARRSNAGIPRPGVLVSLPAESLLGRRSALRAPPAMGFVQA